MGRRDGQDDSSARLSAGRRGPGSVSSSDHHEGADDLLLLGERSFWQTAQEISYQLLFFMIHGNNGDVRVDLLAVILEDAQLLLFLVSRTADVVYAVPGVLSSSFDLRYDSSDLDSFTFPFLVSAIGVFLMVLNVAIVADGVRGQHRFIWAIASLRLLASWIPTVFQLTILRIFFSVFYCINGYGAQTCSFTSTPYMIIMSAICLLLYIPMSWAISVNFFDTNPTHKGPTNVVHGRSVSAYALCKILLTATWIVLPNKLTWVKMIVVWLVPMVMFIMINTYFPYYSLAINQIRAGIYASIGSVALIAACASIGNSFYSLDRIPVWLFAVMCAILIPTFICGYYLTGYWFRRKQQACYRRLTVDLVPSSHSHSKSRDKHEDNVLVFNNWTEVEITARIFTSHLTFRKRYISKPDLEKVYKIFKRGLKEFPDHPQVRLSYATYLYYLNSSQSDFIKQLRRVASSNASYGIRFQVFFLNQVCNQDKEADQLGSNVKLDVTGYAEFRKIDRLARVNHKQAEECYRTIWVTLMTDRTNAEKIYEQMQLLSFTLNRLVVSTDNCYSSLLAKFPTSKMYLRLYAKFCFDILGDTFKGNALSRRAADLEKEEEGSNRQLNSSANGRRQMGTIEFMDQNESDEEGSFDSLEAGRASEGSQGSQQKPPEDGQGLRRRKIGTRDEDESRSAASHPGTDQAMALLRSKLRMRCETDIQSLRRSAILIGVFVLVLVSSSIGVMCFFLNKTTIYFVNTYWNQQRQHFSALMFRRFRQLQDAYDSNSPTKFGTIQTQLLSEAKYLSYANWFLFQNLNEGEFATVSIKTTNFPGLSIKIPGTATLFDFGQVLLAAANNMGTLPFASLSTIKTDNLFNYVLSNFITVTNSATIITWAIVIPTVRAILAVFLIFRFSVVSFRFVEKQKSVFKIFLKIPRKLVKEQQIFWEEAAEQDLLGVGENSGTRLKLQKLSVGGVFVQLSTIVVSMCLIATCAITAYVNVTAVQQFGFMQTYAIRTTALTGELCRNDMFTWGTNQTLWSALKDDVDRYGQLASGILYGTTAQGLTSPGMSDYPSSVYQIFSSLSCLVLDQSVCDARSTSTTWGSSSFVRNSVSLGLGKLLLYTVDALTEILNGLRTGSVDPSQAKAKFLDEVLEPDYRDGWRRLEQMTLDSTNQVISMATMSNILLCFAEFVVLCIAEIAVFWRTIWFCSGLDRSATELIVRLPSEVKRNPHFLAALRPLLSQGSSRGRSVTSQRRCCRWHWIKAQEGQVHPDDQTLGSEDSLDDAASLDADGQNLLVMLSGGQNQERAESHESLAAKITSSHEQLFDDDDDDSEYEDGDDDDNNDPSARASGSGGGLGRKPTVGRLISPDDEKMDINERIEAFRASSVVPPPRTHDAHSETAVRVGGPADADPFADRAEE